MAMKAKQHGARQGKVHRATPCSRIYYSARWKRFRRLILAASPICVDPRGRHQGVSVPATDVDHIKPIRTHPALTYVAENCQALCKACHSAKTRRETMERYG